MGPHRARGQGGQAWLNDLRGEYDAVRRFGEITVASGRLHGTGAGLRSFCGAEVAHSTHVSGQAMPSVVARAFSIGTSERVFAPTSGRFLETSRDFLYSWEATTDEAIDPGDSGELSRGRGKGA
jgi:hypothetical protein